MVLEDMPFLLKEYIYIYYGAKKENRVSQLDHGAWLKQNRRSAMDDPFDVSTMHQAPFSVKEKVS